MKCCAGIDGSQVKNLTDFGDSMTSLMSSSSTMILAFREMSQQLLDVLP